jgi:hypothetical protein
MAPCLFGCGEAVEGGVDRPANWVVFQISMKYYLYLIII